VKNGVDEGLLLLEPALVFPTPQTLVLGKIEASTAVWMLWGRRGVISG
jgi:hypothetical protein